MNMTFCVVPSPMPPSIHPQLLFNAPSHATTKPPHMPRYILTRAVTGLHKANYPLGEMRKLQIYRTGSKDLRPSIFIKVKSLKTKLVLEKLMPQYRYKMC